MNIAVIGPNGAGKSTLITEIVKENSLVLPFSFSNYPRKQYETRSLRRGNDLKMDDLINTRSCDLKKKWGVAYSRSNFDPNRTFVLDEVFLTKLLRFAPTSIAFSENYFNDFRTHLSQIMLTEKSYVDAYIYVKPNMEKWLENVSRRPVKATIHDVDQVRFQTQIRCLDYYISMIENVPQITISRSDASSLNDVLEFIVRVAG